MKIVLENINIISIVLFNKPFGIQVKTFKVFDFVINLDRQMCNK